MPSPGVEPARVGSSGGYKKDNQHTRDQQSPHGLALLGRREELGHRSVEYRKTLRATAPQPIGRYRAGRSWRVARLYQSSGGQVLNWHFYWLE